MKKFIAIFAFALVSQASFASERINNVFYSTTRSTNQGLILVNTVKEITDRSGRVEYVSDYYRTSRLTLTASKVHGCQQSCSALVKELNAVSFDLVVQGKVVATVYTNDRDYLLPSKPFSFDRKASKLSLNLDDLEKSTKVTVK